MTEDDGSHAATMIDIIEKRMQENARLRARVRELEAAVTDTLQTWDAYRLYPEFAARLRLVVDDSPPSAPPADVTRRVVRHKRRGTTYTVIGEAELQTEGNLFDGSRMVIYQGDDGLLWARQVEEFEDGRFEDVGANPDSRHD